MAPLLAVLLVFVAASAWAGETQTPPTDPPQARVNPPGGVSAQARLNPPSGAPAPPPDATTQARLGPPGGVSTQARLNPPGGAPMTLTEMILIWLQSRPDV